MATEIVDLYAGEDYAKLLFKSDDYVAISFTGEQVSYVCGTNAKAADASVALFKARSTLLFATQDCWVRFDGERRVQHFIPADTYIEYDRRWTTLYVVRDSTNGVLRCYMEG